MATRHSTDREPLQKAAAAKLKAAEEAEATGDSDIAEQLRAGVFADVAAGCSDPTRVDQ